MDDVLVSGKGQQEHDHRLETVMKIVEMSGIRLNKDKRLFRQTKLKLLGHRFTADIIVADPEKVAAILDMPASTTVPLLRQVVGMVHFLGSRGPAQEEAFVKTKMSEGSTPILAYYDAIKSDNAPQLSSSEFKSFAEQYGFAHVTSSPYHSNANGEAERAV